jgi:hypothetical protein
VKSLKKLLIPMSLWLVVGFLAGAAFAAAAESQNGLQSGGHEATLAPTTTTTTATISAGNCLGSNCSTNAFVTLSRLDGSPVSPGNRTLAPGNGGALTVSNISRLNGSSGGLIPNQADRTTGNLSKLTLANANLQPQLHLRTATMTGRVASPYLQGSGGGIGSVIRQLFCSSPARQGCISEILFNSDPTIKSAPTGKITLAPEPTAAFLLGTGLLAIGLIRRRQKTGRS